jgi:hypothetical protein
MQLQKNSRNWNATLKKREPTNLLFFLQILQFNLEKQIRKIPNSLGRVVQWKSAKKLLKVLSSENYGGSKIVVIVGYSFNDVVLGSYITF